MSPAQPDRPDGAAAPGRGPAPDSYEQQLRSWVGRTLVSGRHGLDPVNAPMIRHWAEAMGDANPVYTSAEAARDTGRAGIVAPASMMQTWTMPGLAGSAGPADRADAAAGEFVALLAEGGYTSVVATDSEFAFHRELAPGDAMSVDEVVTAVSAEKRTALGAGRFITTERTYRDAAGAVAATQTWRTLRFRPPAAEGPGPGEASGREGAAHSELAPEEHASQAAPGRMRAAQAGDEQPEEAQPVPGPGRTPQGGSGGQGGAQTEPLPGGPSAQEVPALRPRPAINRDNAFWFAAARDKRLVIQRCRGCAALRHPPGPCCPHCRSFDWDTVEAAGGGTVYSYVTAHHPRHPAFDYPLLIAVVELDEGTRLIANLAGVDPGGAAIGLRVRLDWFEADPELTLPVFRPAAGGP